jgi:chromosome segregation ATPase
VKPYAALLVSQKNGYQDERQACTLLAGAAAMGSAEAEKAKVEQKLQTLQFQNGKLSAQLEVQRSQIAELETRIEAQDAKQSSYADTLLTVNSLWSQLNADIQHLGTRASKVCHAVFQHLSLSLCFASSR